ncbi:LAME_0G01486g1_1 [Lachancea meyersii CBS 8951]|uniref:non-specific serine/threonine protein kinase n=1 Tax=Lachancea meyersii CBS 8951 TaxID=1266667 RepID=A0A1G4K5L7_9SACH|nr:LAME_0G01486g1_1 [Lachancea meyersii CBS 8951]
MSAHSRQSSVVQTSQTTVKGDKIGPWKLGRTLGAGSTGKVHIAQHESTGQQAAVKVVSKSVFGTQINGNSSTVVGSSDPDVLPYGIEREIIIMKLLNHLNVLRLYDVWETNSSLYMVLEYVEKGELFNLLVERGPLPENEAIRFFRQIIIGISYCHALGIVHRDLKPENLLLDHKFNIKIADFGMAALESKDKLLETSCGSPHYAAPEIVSGLPYHGFESDVWSCGVILFALLTGRLPFDEEDGNIRNLLLKVQSGRFEMPDSSEISPEAQDLLSKILTVDPAARIKARGILKHPLLQKYPSIKDSKSIRNLPREDTYLNPLDNVDGNIDDAIIQNLVVLWHGRNKDEIILKLREPGASLEKTFYALLYRFKTESTRDQQNQKRKSQINQTSSPKKGNMTKSTSRRSIVNASTPKRKSKGPLISASSSHKRPVSFNRLPASNAATTEDKSPTPNRGGTVNLSSNKRASVLINTNSSPTPANKRTSYRDMNSTAPPIPVDMLRDYNKSNPKFSKRSSRSSKRLSFLPGNGKRGSMTTKLIATFAKISEDNDWEYIEQETKRTSADFATLCDQIFEHEKHEQIRKEKEELERRVREAKEQEERARRLRAEEERKRQEEEEAQQRQREEENAIRQKQALEQIDREVNLLRSSAERKGEPTETQTRSVSAPTADVLKIDKRGSVIGLESDIQDLLERRTFSLQTRPVSRLDPGIFADTELSQAETKARERDLDTEKTILETIRRSKFLGSSFDITKELAREKRLREERKNAADVQERVVSNATVTSDANTGYKSQTLPKNVAGVLPLNDKPSEDPRKISEVQIPQFTRRSRHFTASNKRLSVLSMYSTKTSFTNLAEHLKGKEDLQSVKGSPPSTSNVDQEAEFMFESVDREGKDTAETSADSRLYEVAESKMSKAETRNPVKLNFADRFNNAATLEKSELEEASTVKLPTLPPLGKQKTNGMSGLGLYQPPSGEAETSGQMGRETSSSPPRKTKSMVPPSNQQGEKSAARISPGEPDLAKKNDTTKREKESARRPLEDITPIAEKKANKSFFRKFSSKSHDDKKSRNFDAVLHSVIEETQMFNALSKLLVAWKEYGLKDVRALPSEKKIKGKLSSDNIFSLRSTLFEIFILNNKNSPGSDIAFEKLSGSSKTFRKLVREIEKILESKKALATS